MSQLSNLERVILSGNGISNIEPISNLTSLWRLDLYSNKISDMSILEQMSIKRLSCKKQQLSKSIFKGEKIDLPKIFLQAKDPNSKLYTDAELEFTNCKLSEDGLYIIPDDNVPAAEVAIRNTGKDYWGLDNSKLEILINSNDSIP